MAREARPRRAAAAFTLVEVLLVIMIIGILATVLVVTIGGTPEGAKKDTTEITITKISGKLEQYYVHVGHYPSDAEGGLDALVSAPQFSEEKLAEKWRGPYVTPKELNDGWGNRLNYEPAEAGSQVAPGIQYKLWSNGPDQQSNTADDITNLPDPSTG